MRRALYLLFFSSLSVSLLGQEVGQVAASHPSASTVRSSSEEVLLDVVVRDKKGRAVNNLKPEDFQITDNGEPKKITSFRLVQGAEAIGFGGARTQLDPLRQIRLVSMIFQCSDTNSRRLAHDAGADLLHGELPQNVYVAVMAIDHKLEVLQPFTNDPELLRKALDRATRSGSTDFSKDTEIVRNQLEQIIGPNAAGAQSTQEQIDNMHTVNPAARAMAQMLLEMIQTEQSYAMAESGRTSIFALLDAVKQQYRLPGRKTILYFSEGFVIPQGVEEPFRHIISIANRSNVSFYAVDAHGLTTTSTNQAAIDMLHGAAQTSHDQATAASDAPVRPDEANLIGTSIDSTRANTQSALGTLADSTGGALIANTNDLRGPLHRFAEDLQTYYEISYNPEIKNYDGSFRKISISMSSSDLRVQSRSGYFALPQALATGSVFRPYEVSLLAALDSPQLPNAFDFQAAALHFRGRQNQPVCELVVEVPLTNVTFLKSRSADQFEGRLSYVALLKDGQNEVVKKFANEVPLSVTPSKLEALKASHFIYTEHFDLPSGRYSLETAVLDGESNKVSARRSNVIMPLPSTALAISSVAAIRNTKDREKSTKDSDPLLIGGKVVSPTLSPVVSKASTEDLPFYLVIYSDKSVAAPPRLVMEFSRNGKVLGNGLPPLGPPDQDGRIQYVAVTPLSRLEPGEFTIRFIVKQGTETAEESASFTLQ